MAAQIQTSDVVSYIGTLGYECSTFIIDNALILINEKDTCFDANNYPDERVRLIKVQLAALMCINSSTRIKSERDLSGDAITFDNQGDIQGQLAASVRQLDTHGCVNELIPATKGAYLRTIGTLLDTSNPS